LGQIDQFFSAFKAILKSKNINYKQVAEALDLSESSVKRILSNKSLSFDRLEELCQKLDISFADICKRAEFVDDSYQWNITYEQEKVLAKDERLLNFFILLQRSGKSVKELENKYQFKMGEVQKFLLTLDKIGLIELYPHNKFKLKGKGMLKFLKDGDVGKSLFEKTKNNYLKHDFKGKSDYLSFMELQLSQESLIKLRSKFEKIIRELRDEAALSEIAENVGIDDYGVMVSYRPWHYSELDIIKKK
jgi:transcriptional regulator with XRE-family HTH domain